MPFLFFFSSRRRHTRSLRDWSSDVCSSDLDGIFRPTPASGRKMPSRSERTLARVGGSRSLISLRCGPRAVSARSEERRVGKEWKSRWSLDYLREDPAVEAGGEQTHESVRMS